MIPTPIEKRFERIITPFQEFIKDQKISSIILVLCTTIAVGIANSRLASGYETLMDTPIGFFFGEFFHAMTLRHWINEGLMALFFFLLGLEIKRELLVGELRDARRSIPVISAAFGGMLMPALIYHSLNSDTEFVHGWGIPMATDTAFSVGILGLLGSRIPANAMIFLTALAIIDDLGAILVIATAYSSSINLPCLSVSAIAFAILLFLNVLGIRGPSVYILGGLIVWVGMLGSGIHATVAGVMIAAVVPARSKRASHWFLRRTDRLVKRFEEIEKEKDVEQPILGEDEQHAVVEQVKDAAEQTTTPLRRWKRALEDSVGLFVMPVFALANAGIPLDLEIIQRLGMDRLAAGIMLGLVFGKSIGISLFAWLAIRLKLGQLPTDVTMRHIVGIGLLGGMGFTMSIFIAELGLKGAADALVTAKIGILGASLIAGIAGYLWLRIRI